MSENLPCPFCGNGEIYSDAESMKIFGSRTGHNFAAACNNCGVASRGADTMMDAIAAWNTRTPAPDVSGLVEALRAIIAADDRGDVFFHADGPCAKIARAELAKWEGR